MKYLNKVLKIICVAANWYFALMMSLGACVNQKPGQFIAAQLWMVVILMVFPLFKTRRDLNADKGS